MPDKILSTDEAICWLHARGVTVSRATLDKMRKDGDLAYVNTRGAFRIGYRVERLQNAFLAEVVQCPSTSTNQRAENTGSFAVKSPENLYSEALAKASSGKRKRYSSNSSAKASNVLPLDLKRAEPLRRRL